MTEERKTEVLKTVEDVFQKYNINKTPYKFIEIVCNDENISLLPVEKFSNQIEGWIQNIDGHYDIMFNPNKMMERQHFTLAHELGHYFLNHIKTGQNLFDNEDSLNEKTKDIEIEANYFAVNFLLPKKLIEKDFVRIITYSKRIKTREIPVPISGNGHQFSDWKIISTELCKKYKVSSEFLCFRLESLYLIDNQLYN